MSLPSRLLGANPSIQVSTLLSGSLSTPSAKQTFIPPSDFESIASYTGSGQGTITFTSIPTDYQHLQVRLVTRMSSSSITDVYMRFNSNSSTVYHQGHLRAVAPSTMGAFSTSDGTEFTVVQSPGTGATANVFGVSIVDIFNYRKNTFKSIRSIYGNMSTSATGQCRTSGGLFESTTAITSIEIFDSVGGGTFLSGSKISLYGIKG